MSPKNKGKFGKGKPAVETEDEFVSGMQKVGDRLRPHLFGLLIAGGVLLVLLVGFFTYRWYGNKKDAEATALYRDALVILDVPVQPPSDTPEPDGEGDGAAEEGAAAEPAQPAAPELDDEGRPTSFPSAKARAEAALAPLDELMSEHGSRDAAEEARILYGQVLLEAGRVDDAVAALEKAASQAETSELRSLAREGIGYALEAKAEAAADAAEREAAYQRALSAFEKVQTKDDGPRRDYALYHQARILAALNREDEAKSALEKALEVAPETALEDEIRQRLAQLDR